MAYMIFKEIQNKGITRIFEVKSIQGDFLLGVVKWRSGWRRYVFETSNSVFDVKCLNEVVEFINELMNERANRK